MTPHRSTGKPETFQEKFCLHFDVPPEKYASLALRLTLYPHAGWLTAFDPLNLLPADRRFVAAVGELTTWRSFAGAASDFKHDRENLRFTRRSLRLRISVFRMRVLFSEVWGGTSPAEFERWFSARPEGGTPFLAD